MFRPYHQDIEPISRKRATPCSVAKNMNRNPPEDVAMMVVDFAPSFYEACRMGQFARRRFQHLVKSWKDGKVQDPCKPDIPCLEYQAVVDSYHVADLAARAFTNPRESILCSGGNLRLR